MKIDMTTGKIIPSFVIFTIPIILGNILQTLYSVVDSVVVGKFVSVSALASIGATGTITFLFIGFIMGLTGGFAIIIGQEYGAKNTDKMKKAIAMGTIISLLFSLIILTLVILFLRQILSLLNTPADIIDGS
ncbi:MAG: MATE family efflux transporter, partial [Spirochaetales bacterium]|nr:MATE family efflux transporter [Spirochaetales bacterium]